MALFIIAAINAPSCYCQHSLSVSAIHKTFLKNNFTLVFPLADKVINFPWENTFFYKATPRIFSNINEAKTVSANKFSVPLPILPADFSTCNYAFFCRQELKIEKATKLPVCIRLGSLAQCNYYEGKP